MSMPATNSGSCVPAPTRVSSAAPVPAVASNAYSNNSGNTGKCNKSSDGRNHDRGRNRHHRGASSYVPSIPEQLPKDCRTPERYITINMEYFGYIAIFFLDIKNLTIMKDRDVGMDEFAIELALWFEEMWTGEIRSCGKGCTLMENLCDCMCNEEVDASLVLQAVSHTFDACEDPSTAKLQGGSNTSKESLQ
ncbi:hypothetical protein IV203_018058 [Nitzschia inconspicua]|uniref:Uncharacterized protein n=1 Tax=Nitzschia inconspicua TaxID=303405 RepID=A0A9K3M2Q3_9STRA|nr:hypothetical protein IV203_018058 [Nitzschia inconspicua]